MYQLIKVATPAFSEPKRLMVIAATGNVIMAINTIPIFFITLLSLFERYCLNRKYPQIIVRKAKATPLLCPRITGIIKLITFAKSKP